MTKLPRGRGAVMSTRIEPPDSLEFFPTPPWATRALFERVMIPNSFREARVWEPAAGEDHMADVIQEYASDVFRSDVHDYGRGHVVGSFVGQGVDVIAAPKPIDWVISNPPFSLAVDFALRGLQVAAAGVALLLRTAWLEGGDRYRELFSKHRPLLVAQFSERVPMTKGRWDPDAGTTTAYAWFVWEKPATDFTKLEWIAPGCRTALTRADDHLRFASRGEAGKPAALPMFGEGI